MPKMNGRPAQNATGGAQNGAGAFFIPQTSIYTFRAQNRKIGRFCASFMAYARMRALYIRIFIKKNE